MATDWTAAPGPYTNLTGAAEYRVDEAGFVRWRGILTLVAAARGAVPIPAAALPHASSIPLYVDWLAGSRSLYIAAAVPGTLEVAYNGGLAAGATVDLDPLAYAAAVGWPAPAPAAPGPRTNTPATFVLAGITFNTGGPDAAGVRWFASIVDGADSPEQALELDRRTGAHGAHFAGGWYGVRPLVLEGQCVAENLDALKAARSRLMAAADLLRVLGVLEINDPGAPWRAEVYRADRPRFLIESGYYATFVLPLASPDHRRYSLAERSATTNLSAVTAGVTANVVADVSAGGGTSSQLVAVNAGNTDAPVRLELAGPLTNPAVTHDETGAVIRLALTVNAGSLLVVEPERRTVTLDGTSRRGSVVGRPGWFALAPGTNTLRLSASSTDPAGALTARWRDAWT